MYVGYTHNCLRGQEHVKLYSYDLNESMHKDLARFAVDYSYKYNSIQFTTTKAEKKVLTHKHLFF